jgi:aminopeptidase
MDPRIVQFAKNIVNYSCSLKKGDKVLIEITDSSPKPLVRAIIKEAKEVGANPFIQLNDSKIDRLLIENFGSERHDLDNKWKLERMKEMDAYIGIRAMDNVNEYSNIPQEKMDVYYQSNDELLNERVDNTKWVVMRYPNNAMAQLAEMPVEEFEDFYFDVCSLDYKKMSRAMDSLVELMEKTDKVSIKGPGTNLEFSIKDIPVVKCDGLANLPDGEVFTAPVKESVNGTLSFNSPSNYNGFVHENITFEFKDGKIIEASSNDSKRLNKILDLDEGARYIGEFAIGVNPFILHPMKDTLFDEKIAGSFHFTPGRCYSDASNGNSSSIHWDLVCIQRADYGGGEIYFDDVLVRKDGLFVLESLECLNPENLK